MKITVNIFLISIVLVAGCSSREKTPFPEKKNIATITGEIREGAERMVTLNRMGPSAFIPVDSVRCDKEGNFRFEFESVDMDFFALKYSDNGYVTLIVRPGDEIMIEGIASDLHPYSVNGSPDSELIHMLSDNHKKVLDSLQKITEETNLVLGQENYSELKQILNNRFDSITADFKNFSLQFITEHGDSPAILLALYNQYGPRLPVFNIPADLDIYRYVDSSLHERYPENEAVNALHSQLSTISQQIELNKKKATLTKGMEAPDFVMKTNNGSLLSLSDLEGSYVLIHFWAAWSKPSLDENRFLKQCIDKYIGKNFTILQVSLDSDRNVWLQTIIDDQLDWNHVSDLNRWECQAVELYNVERIPSNFLVNPKGVIVEKDIFGEELVRKLGIYIK